MSKDVFICHAGPDKEAVARPLAQTLERQGFSVWLDEAEIRWGDSLTQKVNEGLKSSRFVVVVLSESFLERPWPQRELDAALNQEAASGEVRVLALIAAQESRDRMLSELPLLNDKRYIVWDGDGSQAAAELKRWRSTRATKEARPKAKADAPRAVKDTADIPMPRVPRRATDRERNEFLKNGFDRILRYFRDALERLEQHADGISSDLDEIHRYKFIARAYVQGEERCQCKISLSDGLGSKGIAYSESPISIDSDNSYNELLHVSEEEGDLGFKLLMGGHFGGRDEQGPLSPDDAAAALWRRFIRPLEAR